MKRMPKFSMQLLISIIISLALVSIASADFTATSPANLGSTSQDRGVFTTAIVTITNTDGINNLSGIQSSFSTTLNGYTNRDFNVSISTSVSPLVVAPNGSTDLTVQAFVPLKLNSGQTLIGNLVITGTSGGLNFQKTVPVYMSASNKLKITKVELDVNSDTNSISDGKTIKVKRGDSIGLTTTVENMFSSSTNIDISDITVFVDSNGDLDLNEEDSIGTLNPRDDDTSTINFDIPQDASDNSNRVTIRAEGTDDNGALHSATFEFNLDVQVDRYSLTINSVTTTPASACPGQTINLLTDIENTGVRDLDLAQLFFSSDDLNFNKKVTNIIIDQGDSKRITTPMTIPANIAPGTYLIDAQAYYDQSSDSLTDDQSASLVIRNCQATTPTNPTQTTTANQTPNSGFQVTPNSQLENAAIFATPVAKKATSIFGNANTYIIVLVLVNILILVLLVVLLTTGRRYY